VDARRGGDEGRLRVRADVRRIRRARGSRAAANRVRRRGPPDERAPDACESASDAHTAEAGKRAAPDAAALRRERARAATRAEIASIKASARGEAPSAPPSGAREDARSPPRARAAAAAETRRSTDLHAPRASAPAPTPSDDDVVVLDDDEEEADERDLPPFLSVSERRRSSPDDDAARRDERIRGAEGARPRGTRDNDASPRAARPSAAPAPRGDVRAHEHPAMGAVAGRAPRLPPISAGKTFADEYEVVLVVDNREQFGGGRRAAGQSRSEHRLEEVRRIAAAHGIAAEVGHLECGDATWVARRRRGNAGAADDYVLDLAVERKSLEDLKLSIQDDRYRQQKFFLKRSGLRNLGYLVEGDFGRFADRPDVSDQSAKAVASAATQTEVWDGFAVIRTEDVKETFDVLARMTLAMRDRFALARAEDGAAARAIRSGDEEETRRLTPLTLAEYNANLVVAKRSLSTLKNVWGSMLMSTTGLGPEYAQAITDRFPTPGALNAAYADAGSAEAAAALLAHTPVSGNRTVGPVVSKRVYATLFGHELTPLA
jgi:crossover junction endonuclease MUS81